ncbi:argininosuccinate lyase [Sedimentibacter acidaminivorans]|uniref:Argininosuccinate lyase n=1 Tax=Sedimentibacter acidaminivorans TaxID=913099 RepID=A0ABS4G9Y1_9FIRM|nr:argininosuccinate lyase [Sedimentibacter acidaminivorans]MBP1924493.1 argininosuccinate lyase [Sedimentibacter acidaminivorans]
MANLWSGRFEKGMDKIVEEFNASIRFDKRLYDCDIDGSIAHIIMLCEEGIATEEEKNKIIETLNEIKKEIESGKIEFSVHDEDIHMAVEGILIQRLGDIGKKLHTARSRNDQVAVDTRLYVKKEIGLIIDNLKYMEHVLLEKAEKYHDEIMIGFTHMQHAQPVTIGFHLMAYFQMFKRDIERFMDSLVRTDYCPLGSCALAGTTIPINRHRTAEILGFNNVTENAMDSVSDRDYVLELMSASSICMMHISRFAEEFVYWNSQEFGYISIDDSFCTGSSIMPQKKNPDMAELLRGKVGRVYGNLFQLMTVMKGTPLAYNKDFQEDKEGLFDTIDTLKNSLLIFAKMIEKTEFETENIKKQLNKGFLNATDIAEHFVKMKIPFREAHEIVGKMVKYCEVNQKDFIDLTDEELNSIDNRLSKSTFPDLSMEGCINGRVSFGGTAPSEVKRQIGVGKAWLDEIV